MRKNREKYLAYLREYRKTHPDPRYRTPEYNAIQAARMRARRQDPINYQNELSRWVRRRRLSAIERMRKELAVGA